MLENPQTVSNDETGIAWIPVTFNNDFELECYWWLGLKLDRPLPAVAKWPTPSDWPYVPNVPSLPSEDAKKTPTDPKATEQLKPSDTSSDDGGDASKTTPATEDTPQDSAQGGDNTAPKEVTPGD